MENIDKIANIDAIANAIKNNSEDGFFFVPWIGKKYGAGDGIERKESIGGRCVALL